MKKSKWEGMPCTAETEQKSGRKSGNEEGGLTTED